MMTYLQMLLRAKQLFSFGLRIQLLTCYLCVNNLTGSLYKQECFWRELRTCWGPSYPPS